MNWRLETPSNSHFLLLGFHQRWATGLSKCLTAQVFYYWMLLPRAFLLLLNPLRYQYQLLCHASTQRKNHDLKLKNQQGHRSESNERQKLIFRVCMIAILLHTPCQKIIGCIVNSCFLSLSWQFILRPIVFISCTRATTTLKSPECTLPSWIHVSCSH